MDNKLYYCILIIDISFQKKIMEDLECVVEERTMELALANKRLTDVNHELNEVNKYLDNFVHAIAHDLRAPVANLKLIQEMLQIAPDESKSELLSSIHENIHRLDSTLKGLVQIIRSQGDKEPGKPDINVVRIINEVIEEQQVQIRAKRAEINIRNSGCQTINYVEGYIRSIIRNMISNALKYADPGRPPRLDIGFDKHDDHYILQFTDNGIGIDLNKHGEDLFKPFQRFSSKGKGMGIGLHIVNNMVQKNGGHIEVESKPGKSTKFTVYLKEYQV
jgi:signal transduction histidine kinase